VLCALRGELHFVTSGLAYPLHTAPSGLSPEPSNPVRVEDAVNEALPWLLALTVASRWELNAQLLGSEEGSGFRECCRVLDEKGVAAFVHAQRCAANVRAIHSPLAGGAMPSKRPTRQRRTGRWPTNDCSRRESGAPELFAFATQLSLRLHGVDARGHQLDKGAIVRMRGEPLRRETVSRMRRAIAARTSGARSASS